MEVSEGFHTVIRSKLFDILNIEIIKTITDIYEFLATKRLKT